MLPIWHGTIRPKEASVKAHIYFMKGQNFVSVQAGGDEPVCFTAKAPYPSVSLFPIRHKCVHELLPEFIVGNVGPPATRPIH